MRTGRYRHYKGGLYLVLGMAENATNGAPAEDEHVVYVALSPPDLEAGEASMWIRKASEFFDSVELQPDDPDDWFASGGMVPRFKFVG